MTIGPFFFLFTTSLPHFHAMVLTYIPKCSPFNTLSNGIFYLLLRAFVYELEVEMFFIISPH